jgi:hypothetical protein
MRSQIQCMVARVALEIGRSVYGDAVGNMRETVCA